MTEANGCSSSKHVLIEADEPHHFEMAGVLFEEYASQLGIDLCFQGFAAELKQLPQMYGPPQGRVLLVMKGTTAVGCGAIRKLSDGICEMKRLYIREAERGADLGRRVAQCLVQRARTLGYRTMRLDTLSEMTAAQSLYRSLGFCETVPYYDNPLLNVVYMELDLCISDAIS
jgi:putative acetyltransferase